MKKISLVIILVFLCSIGVGVLAQATELPDPGITPDSRFYFLDMMAEGIGNFFTFGDIKKAERYANLAAERLAEIQAVVEKGKPELAEKILERYEKQLNNSIERAKKAQAKGKSAEKITKVLTKIGEATSKHLEVLASVYEKVPEQAKPAIERAMGVSMKGHEQAVAILKEKNALGKVPEKVSLPEKVSKEVGERVERRVEQQLEIDKVLEDFDESQSLRDLCIEQGGPTEACAQFPAKPFKSFKQIENWCLEQEGPAEVCSSVEGLCKDVGVTTPGKCFRVFMIGSVSHSTRERPLPEEQK